MLDIESVLKNLPQAERLIKERGFKEDTLAKVVRVYKDYKSQLVKVEDLRSQRNQAAQARDVSLGKKIKKSLDLEEEKLRQKEGEYKKWAYELPNPALPDVPIGSPDKAKILETGGEVRELSFTPKDHLQLGEWLDVIDTQKAARVSGSRFAYLKNELVAMELALVNFAMEKLIGHGFTPVRPPVLIRKEITEELGYWNMGGHENYYSVSNPDKEKEGDPESLYLIGTAEHALVPMHKGDLIASEELPARYVGYSPSFRRESGSYGKDVRGIIRVHQFDKVEMVSFCRPQDDQEEFETILGLAWELMSDLELPIRKVLLTSEDMSKPAAKTVDIETWFPSQKRYIETHSISTTTDFQARRLNTRFMDRGKTGLVHILNGTAFAVGRTLAAILENYQREDGSVEVPKVLRSFLGFDEIKPS